MQGVVSQICKIPSALLEVPTQKLCIGHRHCALLCALCGSNLSAPVAVHSWTSKLGNSTRHRAVALPGRLAALGLPGPSLRAESIGGVGEPLRHNQPSGPSEFELGRGLPQELGRASIMEESSVLRIADGQQDAARRAQRCPAPGGAPLPDRLRRPRGRSRARGASSAAARWHLSLLRLPAPEAPTGAAPPIWRR